MKQQSTYKCRFSCNKQRAANLFLSQVSTDMIYQESTVVRLDAVTQVDGGVQAEQPQSLKKCLVSYSHEPIRPTGVRK